MRPAGAANFKWSMADVDLVVGLARAGRTTADICERLRCRHARTVPLPFGQGHLNVGPIEATPEEVKDICWQSGISVKSA